MRAILLALILAGAMPGTATAESLAQLWAWCRDNDPEHLIRGCSAIIDRGHEAPDQLARAFFNRGRAFADQGDYQRAIQDFDRAIRLQPLYPDAFNGRALARRGLGQDARAIEDFDQAIKLDPNYAIALYNRALAYQAMGRADDAAKDFTKARAAGPRMIPPKE